MKKSMLSAFNRIFNANADEIFFSPGRVNIIGDHIDYNGGCVFPVAISLGTYGVVNKRKDDKACIYSENFSHTGIIEFSLHDKLEKSDNWSDFIKGVILTFNKKGYILDKGFNLYINGNLPHSSGLSSSASLEVLIATIINDIYSYGIDKPELAIISQTAEVEFVGVSCGIMDQFAIAMGKKNNAVLLDTNSLKYSYIPFDIGNNSILIMNTNKKRELSSSKYNERRMECEQALHIINQYVNTRNLCDLSVKQIENIEDKFQSSTIYKRALHAATENELVNIAVEALKANNIEKLGKALTASHRTLRDNYEVSCFELDCMVKAALSCEGVYGARMTGAGFGGCAIALVANNCIELVIKTIKAEYKKATGIEGELYIANSENGTMKIRGEE